MAGKQMPEEQPVGLDQQEGLGVLQGVNVFVTKFFLRQGIIVQCESHRPGLLGAATCFLIPRALKLLGVLGGRGVIPSCSPEGIYLFTAGRQPRLSIRTPHQLFLSQCLFTSSVSIVYKTLI